MSSERTRPAPVQAQTQSEQSPEPHQLLGLLQLNASASTADRINSVLIAMRLPGNEKNEAAAILKALDAKQFDRRVDSIGRSCRKEAVETLLACGFPHALSVSPEDLEFARNWRRQAHQPLLEEEEQLEKPSTGTTRMMMWVMVAAAVAQTVGLGLLFVNPGATALSAVSAALFGWSAALTRLEATGDTMFAAVLLGIFGAAASVLCGLSAGAAFAGGAFVAGLAMLVLAAGASTILEQEKDQR